MSIDQRLLDAYYEYRSEQVRAGVIDCSLTENIDDDRPIGEKIRDILRKAGRLPEGYE